MSVGALVDRYIEHELPERRHSTQQSHSSTLNRWIRPRWGDHLLEQVKPVAVEEWLRSLALAPHRAMVLVAACLGLRASEIMGLQWGDCNWEDLTVFIRRGVVNGKPGDTKTEASPKALPVDARLLAALAELRKSSLHNGPQDGSSQTVLADPGVSRTSCSAI